LAGAANAFSAPTAPSEAWCSSPKSPGSATDALCRAALAAGDARAFRVELLQPDGSYYEIDVGVIAKGYKRSVPIDGVLKATLTLRFTGASTETDI
jgi:hypothetical protein